MPPSSSSRWPAKEHGPHPSHVIQASQDRTANAQASADIKLRKLDAEQLRLVLQRCELNKRRNACSPLHRLPDECLVMIFLFAAERKPTSLLKTSDVAAELMEVLFDRHQNQESMIFSQVCTWWRDVTLSTPRLWSMKWIVLGRAHSDSGNWISRLSEHISRVKAAPMNLVINYFDKDPAPVEQLLHTEIDIVTPLLLQCRRLMLNVSRRRTMQDVFLQCLIANMPKLEEFYAWTDAGSLLQQRAIPMPTVSLKLKCLQLKNVDLLLFQTSYLSELTCLQLIRSRLYQGGPFGPKSTAIAVFAEEWRLQGTELSDYLLPLNLLQVATKLEQLTLAHLSITLPVDDAVSQTTFSALHTLKLDLAVSEVDDDDPMFLEQAVDCVESSQRILKNISMPALRSFTFVGSREPVLICNAVLDIIRENHTPLEALSLAHTTYTTDALLGLLLELPRLKILEFETTTLSEKIFKGLASQAVDTTPCPVLQEVTIKRARYEEEEDLRYTSLALKSMVESRFLSTEVATLSKLVVIDSALHITASDRAQILQHVAEGDILIFNESRQRWNRHQADSEWDDSDTDSDLDE